MAELPEGLYEVVITEALQRLIDEKTSVNAVSTEVSKQEKAEIADRLSLHVGQVLKRVLVDLPDSHRGELAVGIVRRLVNVLSEDESAKKIDLPNSQLAEPGKILRGVFGKKPSGEVDVMEQPLTPLLDTILLTNDRNEPRIGQQINTEIESADRIDLLMAFVRFSGIRPYLDKIEAFCDGGRGKPLRLITTTYTNSTEAKALQALKERGVDIRVSYDVSASRLHAKAWHFHRKSGASTAYIGSSNLTYSAQETGLEWNVRVSGIRNPDVLRKVTAMFDSYWESGDFEPFVYDEFTARTSHQGSGASVVLSPLELRLEPFQERLLEQISAARSQGHHKNLLVAATGTGKTVMAAADFASLRSQLGPLRLLFVAHREEILEKSRQTFCHVLRDPNFGELWVGRHRPGEFKHVFASIQTLNKQDLTNLEKDHFDIVIVDEFHHAAAESYSRILDHLTPRELLGLTATPERADGLSVLDYFDGRITAELRLWDAIDQRRLVPFHYYGVHDGLDLTHVPWKRGAGYDVSALENVFTSNDAWARLVIKQLENKVDNIERIKAFGFCVSIAHAQFMANHFNKAGVKSVAVWGSTPEIQRKKALSDLNNGELQVVFSVDLFNEGVDVPSVDTLLLLRPTQSATLFLQQLGRGLRRSIDKSVCTVLDFVGNHRKEFRFDIKLRALLGGSRKSLERQVDQRFPYLPAGCHMELDKKSSEIVLSSLRTAIPSNWTGRISELGALYTQLKRAPSIHEYLEETGLDLEDLYSATTGKSCWSDMLESCGIPVAQKGPYEDTLRKSLGRLLHINDPVRIATYRKWICADSSPIFADLEVSQQRLLRMLVVSVCDQVLSKTDSLEEGVQLLWQHPQVLMELFDILEVLQERIDHVHEAIEGAPSLPLRLHGKYSRLEILSGFGDGTSAKTPTWREGVKWLEAEKTDVFVFTLNKTTERFSPTTMYRDYAISPSLIHWESQSGTSADSPTGQRYQQHMERGSKVMLFARESSDDRAFWFLGPASYVSHESERPMGVRWRLANKLPGDLYEMFVAAVS